MRFMPLRKNFLILTIVFFVITAILSGPGIRAADDKECCPVCESPEGINSGLPDDEVSWEKLEGFSGEQHAFMVGFFEEGLEIFTTVFAFKYGFIKKFGYYSLLYENSTGKSWFVKGECKADMKDIPQDSLNIDCGEVSLSGKWPEWKLKVDAKEFQGKLYYHALAPPFKAGNCYYSPDREAYLDTLVFMPMARVQGTIVTDGERRKVSGRIYGDHSDQNLSPTRQGPFYYAVRAFPDFAKPDEDKLYLNFSSQALHKAYGGGFDKFAFVIRGGEILFYTRELELTWKKLYENPDTGYKYVRKVNIDTEADGYRVKGTFTVDEVIEIMDIYQWLPKWARKIAEKFWKRPVYFRFLGKFRGRMETPEGETVKLNHHATSEMNFTQ